MLWDCGYCGKTKLLGLTHRHCPECGAKQDATKRYFPSEADKVKVQSDDYAGSDRICPNCQHASNAKAQHCAGCGAPLDGAQPAPKVVKTIAAKPKSRWWIYAIVIVLVLILALYVLCFRKKAGNFEVTAQTWERRIEVEEYVEKSGSNWRDEVPTGADLGFCHDKEQRAAVPEDCQKRQVDQGDGTMKEITECTPAKPAVVKPWCSYTLRQWQVIDELTAREQGDAGDERMWPDSPFPTQVTQRLGARREARRVEVLKVELEGTGGTHTCEVNEALWTKLTPGTKAKGSVRGASDAIVCEDLAVE